MNAHFSHSVLSLLALCLAGLGATGTAAQAQMPPRDELGRSVKMRILVDKVMQKHNGWAAEEWMVAEAAGAGFNVYSPRTGFDRSDEVRRVAQWCANHGIYYIPWMRGSLSAPDGPEANGQRLVWASGNEQPLWSPNSDAFWDWTTEYVVQYAKLAAEMPNSLGVFLDYENYARGKEGNLYSLSYDDIILGKFATANGMDIPQLALDERAGWLREQGLADAFESFQVAHWRERARTLRDAVDAHAPGFQFCIYPAPGTPFMVEALYPEWATAKAPLILADASTYGRPSGFMGIGEALAANRRKLEERKQVPREAGIQHIYLGGIDPVVQGATPEFCGRNAAAIAGVTDGYWVFYEGPGYTEGHPEYFRWFKKANESMTAGRYTLAGESTAEALPPVFAEATEVFELALPESPGGAVASPTVMLRRENLAVLALRAGSEAEITLRHHRVGNYTDNLHYIAVGPGGDRPVKGEVPFEQTAKVRLEPEKDGIWLLGLSAGGCAYSIVSANVPVGLYAGTGLQLFRGAGSLFFHAPEDATACTIETKGSGGETARVNIYAPDGALAATGQTTRSSQKAAIPFTPGAAAGKVWRIEVTRADEGALEDNALKLLGPLPPVVSLDAARVFRRP